MKKTLAIAAILVFTVAGFAQQPQYLGTLNANPYSPNSVANPYGQYGSPYSATSINNPYGQYGSPYSTLNATNPYTTNAPKLYAPDGTYLGNLSTNPTIPTRFPIPTASTAVRIHPPRLTIPTASTEAPTARFRCASTASPIPTKSPLTVS